MRCTDAASCARDPARQRVGPHNMVDTRGFIYVTDKQWGVWILRYAGPDQPAPTDR
jgi:hypothetical protein